MTRTQKIRTRIAALAIGAGFLLLPLTVGTGSVQVKDACADGSCCAELGSSCTIDGKVRLNADECKGGVNG